MDTCPKQQWEVYGVPPTLPLDMSDHSLSKKQFNPYLHVQSYLRSICKRKGSKMYSMAVKKETDCAKKTALEKHR